MKLFKQARKYGVGAVIASGATGAFAAGVDLTSLTSAVDLSTVVPAIIAVGAILMAPKVAKYAVNVVQRMFPG